MKTPAQRIDPEGQRTSAIDVKRKPPELKLAMVPSGVLQVKQTGRMDRIDAATMNPQVAKGLVGQIATLGAHGKAVDPDASNFALGFVDGMAPKDPAEALLLNQMAATHQATMMMARRLNTVENIRQQDAAERALNKLDRSYAAQMDTLKRYRSKGQPTVRVERVTLQDGGRAIVGNVQHGGRGGDER